MPNHVTTIVKSSNKDLINKLNDFTKIIPMPIIFNELGCLISMSNTIQEFIDKVKEEKVMQKLEHIDKEVLKNIANKSQLHIDNQAILQAYCYLETGYKNSLDWARANWGTKWNSYDFKLTDEGCKFNTAWTHPLPILKKLSEMYPEEDIEVMYADEDIGYNLGYYKIKNGSIEIILNEEKESEKDRVWFALCVKGLQEEYVWSEEEQTYIHKEDLN